MYPYHRSPRPGFPTVEALRTRVITGLQEALREAEITAAQDDPNQLLIQSESTGAKVVHLGNLATELVGQLPPAEAEARVRSFIDMVQSLTRGGRALTPDRLYPALRHRDFPLQSGAEPLTRPAPGDCLAVLMSDEGTHTAMVTQACLAKSNLMPEAAWEAAEENFARALTDLALYAEDGGLLSLEIEHFEWLGSSLLLAPAVISHMLAAQDIGAVYLAAPSRQSVDMIPVEAPGALGQMRDWMAERLAEPHPQSDMLYRLAPGDVAPRPTHVFEQGSLHALT
ncbi:hypothetical protein ACN2XU_18255 [Primorskyibacter sp. 2E107]|uniref:hypothetical protein n=1 Tax=Primorskyibacter sp. 2E107 TaxID=3403458 RepID=UPI003AF74F71